MCSQTVVYVQAANGTRDVSLRWVVPRDGVTTRKGYGRILQSILVVRGPGSLYNVLHGKGWILNLSAGDEYGDIQEGYEYYHVEISLTEDGWGVCICCHEIELTTERCSSSLEGSHRVGSRLYRPT